MTLTLVQIYLIAVAVMSVITFGAFAVDKIKSRDESTSRVPEIALLSFMGFGGAVGGLFGMYLLRHKTNFKTKYHFGVTVWLALALQVALAVFLAFFSEVQ